MKAIARDKINYHKVYKYSKALILKECYPKTKNMSYYLKHTRHAYMVELQENISEVTFITL